VSELFGDFNDANLLFLGGAPQWLLWLPLAYVWGVVAGGGMVAIWLALGIYRAVFAAAMVARFLGAGWTRIEV